MNYLQSKGRLNNTFANQIVNQLNSNNIETKITFIEQSYKIDEEIDKYVWADIIIYQIPSWWMGPPWIVKKYMDDVWTMAADKLFINDGRTRFDPTKLYGSGGLCQNKKIMVSSTWNAPKEAFYEKGQFFDAKGLDGVFDWFYKAHKFLGITNIIKEFTAFDVIKKMDFEYWSNELKKHIQTYIIEN